MGWTEWLEALPHAVALRQSATLYMLANAAHILAIGLLTGAILPLDLRLMGLIRSGSLAVLAPFLVRMAGTGLAFALLTGFCLFSVKPAEYLANPAFLAKIALLALGLTTVALQHAGQGWNEIRQGSEPGGRVRVLAALSFITWLATLVAGRWIGFV